MKKILVVEDNPLNLALAEQLLEDDYEVIVAVDGEQAVEMARQQLPDLILMDLSLPKMDGWQATAHIRREPTTRGIPIIALTAHAIPSELERALEMGCDSYVTKPIDEDLLLGQIAQHLRESGK